MRSFRSVLPQGALFAVVSRGANAALAFAGTLVLARALGPESYGPYALAISVLGLASLAAQLGLDILTPRNLGIYVHDQDWPHAFSFIRWTTRLVLVASVVVYALSWVAMAWNPMHWAGSERLACRIILLGLPFVALLRLSRSRLQAFDRTAQGLFYELPVWNGLVLVGGIGALVIPEFRSSAAMSAFYVIAFVAAWAGAHLAVERHLPERPDRTEPVKVEWLRSGAFFTALTICAFLASQVGIILVATLRSPVETGHFGVAFRTASLTLIVLQPLQQVVAPRIAKAWSKGDRGETVRLARRCGQISLLVGIAMLAFFWVFGALFLRIYGPAYGDALWALRWLSLSQVIYVSFGPGSMTLQMIHEEKRSLLVLLLTLAVGLPVAVALTLKFGIAGAGLAQVLLLGGASFGSYVALRRLGLDIAPFRGPIRAAAPTPGP